MSAIRQKATKKKSLHFVVSAGLKRVIGRDLITDDEVAIFELVKNSFDAAAKKVQLFFSPESIVVVDDGNGMSHKDIIDKWLLVAYSMKREKPADQRTGDTYREQIASRRYFAGSKGIGRFSSDRLGHGLGVQSRPKGKAHTVYRVDVDWDTFEEDEKKEFVDIPITYYTTKEFSLPRQTKKPNHGTAVKVTALRAEWNRKKLLRLKASLAKMINPFGAETDQFELEIIAPAERAQDEAVREEYDELNTSEQTKAGFPYHEIVNGQVQNFIFDTLQEKTTFIEVSISQDGQFIESVLTDRGERVYSIREPNPYGFLNESGFRCHIFYLNLSAKQTFARRMGVPSVQFGSVFLFRNGIRVFPIGEEYDDSFGIQRRKQQGYARFLGTRDIIGRIDVFGSEEDFKEATSRNQGLIRTAAYVELKECFSEKCLKRLERYVVGVSWPDKGEKNASDLSRLLNDPGRARVTEVVAQIARAKHVELLSYSPRLVQILDEKSDEFEGALRGIRIVAHKTKDQSLVEKVEKAEKRFRELRKAEEEARAKADEERKAREQAEAKLEQTQVELTEEKKRSLFLASLGSQDMDTVLNLHHQIVIYANDSRIRIANKIEDLKSGESCEREDILSFLFDLSFLTQKTLSAARFATKANFRLDADYIEEDLTEFILQYVYEVTPIYNVGDIEIKAISDGSSFRKKFKPIEVSMIIDNLVHNARKAKATEIVFAMSVYKGNELFVTVEDDGIGLSKKIHKPDDIFEKGVTSTNGSGLGLYHVRQILGEMGGSITVDPQMDEGIRFEIRVIA